MSASHCEQGVLNIIITKLCLMSQVYGYALECPQQSYSHSWRHRCLHDDHTQYSWIFVVQDHKPQVELAEGRLATDEIFMDEEACYLSAEVEGQEAQRLAVSRSLGDFDMPGIVPIHFAQNCSVKCKVERSCET